MYSLQLTDNYKCLMLYTYEYHMPHKKHVQKEEKTQKCVHRKYVVSRSRGKLQRTISQIDLTFRYLTGTECLKLKFISKENYHQGGPMRG